MSYEFNTDNQTFDLPNPYKVENLALMVGGASLILAGGSTMVTVRERLSHGADSKTLLVVLISIGLLSIGIGLLARALSQLRYFFGRNRPESLAPLVDADRDGDSQQAHTIKETLRQNAITFDEPRGALNGLLYSWLPQLIFAPAVIQRIAQAQFFNFLALAVTLLSFAVCWFMFGQGSGSGWIGLAYAVFSVQLIRKSMSNAGPATSTMSQTANIGTGALIALFAMAVLGPVVLGIISPHLPPLDLSINASLAIALFCALVGCGVFGVALKNQLQPPPQAIGSAFVTKTVTMNAHPNKLIEELDRILMNRWFSRIPNRRYTRSSPIVDSRQGSFGAEILEETQPRPLPNRTAVNLPHALSTPQFRWLAFLTLLAMAYVIIGGLSMIATTRKILNDEPISSMAAFSSALIVVGMYCSWAAHKLWGRFDFVSELVWVDINGSYESARVNVGNQISGNIHTSKDVINVEAMTIRVWVSEIDSVIFGKDAARQIIGMRGMQSTADELADALKGFGEERAMVLAPGSQLDAERAQKIGAIQQLIGEAKSPATLEKMAAASLLTADINGGNAVPEMPSPHNTLPSSQSCGACNTPFALGARFCGECGKALTV